LLLNLRQSILLMSNDKSSVAPDPGAILAAKLSPADEATFIAKQTSLGHSLPGRAIGEVEVGAEIMPAREVGRYQIIEKFGEGAMATVYKAFDPSINRSLVIKFLHANLCATEEYRQRFLREAKAAGMLSHPNIVTIFDVGEIENRPYIAMELLDGGPLDEMIPSGTELPLREVITLGIQIANALDYAHSKGIFHRDVKPANIIRLAGGKTIKLVDFGIAHVAAGDAMERTTAGTIMGTPHYMSPEQARGDAIDARSDLWAVGVILYQLLTGRRPFNADSIATLLLRITQETPKPVGELRADIPASLRRVIARTLNKQPDKRYQSGRELAEALTRVLIEIDPTLGVGQSRRRGMQLKVKLALAMAAVVAITMTVTSLFVTHRQYQAMRSQTIDQGASLAKLIAVEHSHQTLSEDWVGIDVSVQAIARALDARGLSVIDIKNIVRVSTDAASVGKPHQSISGEPLTARDPAVSVSRQQQDGAYLFAFVVPIKFQTREIGKVQLMLPEEGLAAVVRESWWLMALLLVVTAVTATLATYLMLDRYARPLRTLGDALDEIRDGRYDCRIEEARSDEIGDLYDSFNGMAANLEQKATDAAAAQAGTTPRSEASA
jgi:HAMP domain-containing protein/tRNA A-37 threonylcarbamoyl transferase component Bud32